MKKSTTKELALVLFLLPLLSYSQGGNLGNFRTGLPGNFLGFNGGIAGDLQIRNDFNFQTRFFTNTFQRMLIDNGAGGTATSGRVAFSNNIPAGFAPAARLHAFEFGAGANGNMFRTDGNSTFDNSWRIFTGNAQPAATEKFRLFVPANNDTGFVPIDRHSNCKMTKKHYL